MKRITVLLALAIFAAAASACAQSATDQVVEQMSGIHRPTPKPAAAGSTTTAATGPMDAGLYKDAKGKEAATSFATSETVYLAAKNVSGAKGDKLVATWYYDSGKSGKNKKVFDSPNTLPDTGVYNPSFSLPPAKPASPTGGYHVQLSLNGKVLKSLTFTIK